MAVNQKEQKMLQQLCQFPAGSMILQEGEVNLDMYKIIRGKAEIYVDYGKDEEILLGIIKEEDCFGEFGLLLKRPAIYTVIAYTDIVAIRITEGVIGDFIAENNQYVLRIMKNMAKSMMTMKYHIDLMASDIKELQDKSADSNFSKKSQRDIYEAKRALRSYAIYGEDEIEALQRKVGMDSEEYDVKI